MSVVLDEDFSDGTQPLRCPKCNDWGGLHHGKITVFTREREDDKVMQCVVVDDTVSVFRTETDRNPSSRRDGLTIGFWCEHCSVIDNGDDTYEIDATFELTIAQHKGITLLQWRNIHET